MLNSKAFLYRILAVHQSWLKPVLQPPSRSDAVSGWYVSFEWVISRSALPLTMCLLKQIQNFTQGVVDLSKPGATTKLMTLNVEDSIFQVSGSNAFRRALCTIVYDIVHWPMSHRDSQPQSRVKQKPLLSMMEDR